MLKFLTAKWQNLVMVNYAVDPEILTKYLPAGTDQDFHDGKCFVSLVGFMFRNTRVLGMPVPFHINFEEINLRFYVRREIGEEVRRGVVFIKELVPRFAIAVVARNLYGEPYEAVEMGHGEGQNWYTYSFQKGGRQHSIRVEIGENLGIPDEGTHGSFIIEHYWGYTRRAENRTDEYRVAHPKWELFSVTDCDLNINFGITYGPDFAFMNSEKPYSIVLAKGSEIAVYKGKTIKT
jgi:uncharacterized protein YqjF (DUF2071 family)